MILLPLPSFMCPTARPPFSPLQRKRRSFLSFQFYASARSAPDCQNSPIAGIDDGKSGRADTYRAVRAIAPPCPAATALHSALLACLATNRVHPIAVLVARSARSVSIGDR